MSSQQSTGEGDKGLFWACFLSLIATAFGFIIRAMIINDWGHEFGLSETEKAKSWARACGRSR